MVNLTKALLAHRNPRNIVNDTKYWRHRQILKLSAAFYGRSRNCFSIAVRRVQKSLEWLRVGRVLHKEWHSTLWEDRISAGCREHGYLPSGYYTVSEGLTRKDIHLNRMSLANLAIWEPRTFRALNQISAFRCHETKYEKGLTFDPKLHQLGPVPTNVVPQVIRRGS